jgi:O-antigen/teichoic acid export membrane protein
MIAAALISLPLTSRYLGTERFGLWLTLGTLLSWIGIADLGLSHSLTNAVATADGQSDKTQAKEAVSSALVLMSTMAGVIWLLQLALYPFVPWEQVFNVTTPQAVSEAGPAVLLGTMIFVLRLPLSIPGRVYGAYQENYWYQLWSGLGSILSVVGLIIAIYLRANLPWLVVAFFGTALLGDLISAVHLFGWQRRWLRPSLHSFSWIKSKWLLRTGAQFGVAQLSASLLFHTDLIIIAQLFGANAAARYGIALKVFALIGIIHAAFITPLWAAYGEASSSGDTIWVRSTFKQSVWGSLVWALPVAALLLIFSTEIFGLLVNRDAMPEKGLMIAIMVTEVLSVIARCIAVLLNGLGCIRSQVIFGPVAGVANIMLSIFLASFLGAAGVAWATGICLLVFWLGIIGSDALKRLRSFSSGSV